ncbi:hypothetical protein HBI62_071730 [Parastagonospora nodorum]|nr:hypothetical protein HBI62_071730 [Parastagonospora nodorum]KAH6135179.1 hypothetical protein HBI63_239740 [Parastagonospora nodorum]
MADSPRARTLINLSAVLNMDLNFVPSVAFISDVYMADSLRARTLINLSAVLNIDLDFVPGVAFISDVYIADSLRARTLINLSAVLYEQAAARTSLSAEVGNISPRARTLINPSAVLYEQADARSGLSAEVSIIDLDFVPSVAFDAMGNVELTGDLLGDADRVNNNNNNVVLTLQFSLTALLNLRSLASKRSALSGSDLDRGPSLAKRIKTDEDRKKSTHRDDDDVQLVGDNIEELIYVSKVKHTYISFCRAGNNRNNLNIMVTNPTGREFSRVDIKSLTRFEGPLGLPFLGLISMTLYKFYKGKNIQLLRPVFKLQRYDYYNSQDSDSLTRIQAIDPSFQTNQFTHIYVLRSIDEIRADVADVFDTVVSKSDKVPTQELSTLYFMWDKEQDYSAEEHDYRKFYCLVITGEDTHYKQIIKKAYIMSLERASLILFII